MKKVIYMMLAVSMLVSTVGFSESGIKERYEKGLELMKRLKRIEAKEIFTKIINENPNHAESYYQRGLINKHFKDYEKATDDFVAVTRVRSVDRELKEKAHFEIADIKMLQNDYRGAVTDLSIIINENGSNATAYYLRGRSKLKDKKYNEALADFNKAIELNKEDKSPYYEKGIALIELEKYDDAISALDTILMEHTKHADAYFYRGIAYHEEALSPEYNHHKRNLQNALEDYNKALKLDPEIEEAYFDRGEIKMKMQDYVGAIADFKRALELDPKDLEAHYLKALCNYHYGYEEIALKEFQQILKIDPTYANAQYQVAVIHYEFEEYQMALEEFDRLIGMEEAHADAFLYRGYTKLELNDKEGACDDFKKADKLGDSEAHHDVKKFCK